MILSKWMFPYFVNNLRLPFCLNRWCIFIIQAFQKTLSTLGWAQRELQTISMDSQSMVLNSTIYIGKQTSQGKHSGVGNAYEVVVSITLADWRKWLKLITMAVLKLSCLNATRWMCIIKWACTRYRIYTREFFSSNTHR